jgi:hypothetical protein
VFAWIAVSRANELQSGIYTINRRNAMPLRVSGGFSLSLAKQDIQTGKP